ncbi:hypothetical protein [Chitinibacter sp. S2-10]|uniref:hypothetical protein n=1 Tax=Chitinibacter sp. S2-10 TaxID=3373597 RepID=UPI0039774E43
MLYQLSYRGIGMGRIIVSLSSAVKKNRINLSTKIEAMAKKFLLGLLATGGIIAATPLVFPYSLFKNSAESTLSKLSGTRAAIGSIKFHYNPAPEFILERIILDSADTAQIGTISIPVTLHNVMNWNTYLRDITLKQAEFSLPFAIDLPNKLQPNIENQLKIGRLNLEQVAVKLEQGKVGPVNGLLRFKSDGSIDDLLISSDEGRAELQVQPSQGDTFKVQFNAKGWDSPLGYPVHFEYLKLIGTAHKQGIEIADIRADLYGGLATGNAQLQWGDDHWILSGQLFSKNLQAEPLIQVFSPITRSSGRMNGDAIFRFEAKNYSDLFKRPQINGRFIIQDGMLSNFDLVTPLKSQNPTVQSRGGQTNFNTLVGGLKIDGNLVQLHSLTLDAGKFRSRGNVNIKAGALTGSIASQLAAGVVTISNQLNVAGTLNAPELRSGGAYRPELNPKTNGPPPESTTETPQ